MKKYYLTIKTEFQRQLTYRIENYAYRLSDLLEIFALLIVWIIAYKNTNVIAGYSQSEMITYVLIGWLFMCIGRTYGLADYIADEIFEGKVSNFLLKPVSYLRYITVLSLARSSISVFSAVAIQSIVILAFSKYIIFNPELIRIILILAMLFVSYFITVFVSMIIGMIAFWTQKISGIEYTLNTMINFLSGAYFPISLLSGIFLKIDMLFPFIYKMYFPANIYLGKITLREGFIGLGIEIVWLFLLYGIIKIMWKRGVRKYEGVGI